MPATTFRSTADAIAYTLGEPPQQVEWAIGYQWPDGLITHAETRNEAEARRDAEDINIGAASNMLRDRPDPHHPVRSWAAYRETRMLPDGTQIISPWTEAKEQ